MWSQEVCPGCETTLAPQWRVCPACGHKFRKPEAQPTSQAIEQPNSNWREHIGILLLLSGIGFWVWGLPGIAIGIVASLCFFLAYLGGFD